MTFHDDMLKTLIVRSGALDLDLEPDFLEPESHNLLTSLLLRVQTYWLRAGPLSECSSLFPLRTSPRLRQLKLLGGGGVQGQAAFDSVGIPGLKSP